MLASVIYGIAVGVLIATFFLLLWVSYLLEQILKILEYNLYTKEARRDDPRVESADNGETD